MSDAVEGAIVTITDASYIAMYWFVALDADGPRSDDWLAIVYRDNADAPWRLTSRFRVSDGGDLFNPNDQKRKLSTTGPDGSDETRDKLIAAANVFFEHLRSDPHNRAYRIQIEGDGHKMVRLLRKQKWFHRRVVARGPEAPQ